MLGLPEKLASAAKDASKEKATEPLNSQNFLEKLKDVKFDPEAAIQESVNAVNSTRGYKLIKAEALVENGKVITVDDMEEVSGKRDLERSDIEAFLKLNGGDKFLERLFVYGMSRIRQDFYRQEKNFHSPSVPQPKGIEGYRTFEQAFDAGFYDIKPDLFHVMMYGLSVTEYQHRDERFVALRKRLRKIEKEQIKSGLLEEVKDRMAKVPEQEEKKPEEKKKAPEKVLTRLGRAQRAYQRLISLGHAFMMADNTMLQMKSKYPDSFRGIELSPFYKLDDRREYELQFLGAVRLEAAGQDMTLEDALANIDILTDKNVDKFTDGYAVELDKRMEMMHSVLRALYVVGGNGSDPRGLKDNIMRKEAIKRAKQICPDIGSVERSMDYIRNTYRSFVVRADAING